MITFGLNRPLFSFGLSYPGYFFVVIEQPEGIGLTLFKVYEANRYRATELTNIFREVYGHRFIAAATNEETLLRVFYAFDEYKTFYSQDILQFLAKEREKLFKVSESSREFTATDSYIFFASETENLYRVSVEHSYLT